MKCLGEISMKIKAILHDNREDIPNVVLFTVVTVQQFSQFVDFLETHSVDVLSIADADVLLLDEYTGKQIEINCEDHLAESLKNQRSMTALVIKNCSSDVEAGGHYFHRLLKHNPLLTEYCIEECNLDNASAYYLIGFIYKNRTLTKLSIKNNNLSSVKTTRNLLKACHQHPTLRTLDLIW